MDQNNIHQEQVNALESTQHQDQNHYHHQMLLNQKITKEADQEIEEVKINHSTTTTHNDIQNYHGLNHFLTTIDPSYPIPNFNYHRIALAPMIDITDVHFRNFMRLLTRCTILYTEMIHEQAIHHHAHGPQQFLNFDPVQHPVVIQLGGNDPDKLASAAKICEELGYDEINLNVGCPSDKVLIGKFGACLMKEPELVAEIMKKMQSTVSIPCSVKCRLGVDDFDSYEFAKEFIQIVSEKGNVKHFVVHARKAYLKGLNPTQNRTVPPLKYDYVMRLKKDFPHLTFSINGGFKTYESIEDILKPENGLHGCMIGRTAYETPWFFSDIDRRFYGKQNPGFSRREILKIWGQYGKLVLENTNKISIPTLNKPIINLFTGENSGNRYRIFLSERANYLKYANYQEFLEKCIEDFEVYNSHSLDLRPPGCEEGDFKIVEDILNSVKIDLQLNQNDGDKDNSCSQNIKQKEN